MFDLYLITPELPSDRIERAVAQALERAVRLQSCGRVGVQLRAKHLDAIARNVLGVQLRARTRAAGAALLVSGDLGLCGALDADGVQLPEHGPSVAEVRACLGADVLIGASRHDLPGIVRAQARPAASKTVRAVMHGDLRSFDPVWTTANITAYHGAMIYDTLFGIDAQQNPKPQMVEKWALSDDKKTYTFQLRDGLKFSDGAPVTTADVIASVRRWAVRDGGGQHMMLRVQDISAKDDDKDGDVDSAKWKLGCKKRALEDIGLDTEAQDRLAELFKAVKPKGPKAKNQKVEVDEPKKAKPPKKPGKPRD